METWRDVKGFEKLYEVSDLGRVRSKRQNKIMSASRRGRGYWGVSFYVNGKQKAKFIHRLVAEAFIDNSKNLPCVNHKDENKNNNKACNLEWCSYSYNNKYGSRMARITSKLQGRKASSETRQKMSLSHRGQACNKRAVVCLETKEVFSSAQEASLRYGLNKGAVGEVCRGKNKSARGLHWEYL